MSTAGTSIFVRVVSVLGAVLVAVIVLAAIFGDNGVARHEMLESELANVVTLNAALEAENRVLARRAHALRHDPQYIESVVRDELGWVRADEIVLMFDDGEARR